MNSALRRVALVGLLLGLTPAVGAAELLPPGHRPLAPGVHALVGATVQVNPSNFWNNATVVIRDGLIEIGRAHV